MSDCKSNPCQGTTYFTPYKVIDPNFFNPVFQYSNLVLPDSTSPNFFSPGENFVYPLSDNNPKGISFPDGSPYSYLDQIDNAIVGIGTDDSIVSLAQNFYSNDYGPQFANTFFSYTDRAGFFDGSYNNVHKLSSDGNIYRVWPFLGKKDTIYIDKVMFKVLNPVCGTDQFCYHGITTDPNPNTNIVPYGWVNHSCSNDRMCNYDSNTYGLEDGLQIRFDLFTPSNSYPQAIGLNNSGWTPKTNWFGKGDSSFIWKIVKSEFEVFGLNETIRKNSYFRPIILQQNNYVRAWLNVNNVINNDNIKSNFVKDTYLDDLFNENFTALKYAFFIKCQDKYLTVDLSSSGSQTNSKLLWKTTDFSTDPLNFYWFITPIVEGKGFIFVNVGTQRVIYNTSNKSDNCNDNYCGYNTRYYPNNFDNAPNQLYMNITRLFPYVSYEMLVNNEYKILTCDSDNNATWEYLKIYPSSLGTQDNFGTQYSSDVNNAIIPDRFKIEITKTILPGKTNPVEWNPSDLQYYAPILFCCNESATTLDSNKVGNLLSLSSNNSIKQQICKVTGLEDKFCNQASQTICNNYFEEPKNKDGKIIPLLYNPARFPGTSTTQEMWDKYLEWAQSSTPEGKMCHCFVSDTYYRTYYREQLFTQLENAKSNELYGVYAGYLQTLIDQYVYSRNPIPENSTDYEDVSTNPFYKPRTSFIPGRCYDSTCQTGFDINNSKDIDVKIKLPYYIDTSSGSIDQQPCGTSGQGANCAQFVLNIVENSSANVDTSQQQNCGTNSLGANPFKITYEPFTSCPNTNNEVQVQFNCPWNPFIGTTRNETNIQTCNLSFKKFFNENKNTFNSQEQDQNINITVEPVQNATTTTIDGITYYKYIAKVPCGSSGTPTLFNRYVCDNNTNTCSLVQTNDQTKGYATQAECQNNCKSTIPAEYTRYFCDNNCAGTTVTNPSSGYATKTECLNSCGPTEYTRYICENNVCKETKVTDPAKGYLTQTGCLLNCKPETPQPGPSSSSKTGLIVGIIVLLLLIGGAIYYFKFYKKNKSASINMSNRF